MKQVDEWLPPHPVYASLKQLTREKYQLQSELTLVHNQLHAEETKALTSSASIKRMRLRSRLIQKQISEVEKEISDLINKEKSIKEKIDNVCTIPSTVIAETNGFNLVRNSRQLVSY